MIIITKSKICEIINHFVSRLAYDFKFFAVSKIPFITLNAAVFSGAPKLPQAQKLVGIEEKEFSFSEFAKSCFAEIRKYISANNDYECTEWMKCIASLHYLKNVFRITKSKLVEELQERKPYLSNMNANLKALEIVEGISVGN